MCIMLGLRDEVEMSKTRNGIELKYYEFKGREKRRLFEYHAAPGNEMNAVNILNAKMGLNIKAIEKRSNDVKKQFSRIGGMK